MEQNIETNRHLYQFVAELLRRHSSGSLSLESYLTNLRRLAAAHQASAALSLAEFARLLASAFDPTAIAESSPATPTPGFVEWEAVLARQIKDLCEMDEVGTTRNEHRYFGVDAPSGARWYNFDPCTFLECATTGTFGGWEEGDDTGRAYVPGPVAVLDASGAITTADPRDISDPIVPLSEVSWDDFAEFLLAGQAYE